MPTNPFSKIWDDQGLDGMEPGGDWISFVDFENTTASHKGFAEAAVISVPHSQWQERPLMLVRAAAAQSIDREALLHHLERRIARWWRRDDIISVMPPHIATDKLNRAALLEVYQDHSPKE